MCAWFLRKLAGNSRRIKEYIFSLPIKPSRAFRCVLVPVLRSDALIYAFLKTKLSPRNSNNKTSKSTIGHTDARKKSLHFSSKPHAHHSPFFPQQHAPLQLILSLTAAAAELFYSPGRPTTPGISAAGELQTTQTRVGTSRGWKEGKNTQRCVRFRSPHAQESLQAA